ncbi:hypothetical protein MTP99_008375 [Tenebrio molitor]|nr:hypothetical protein MTP99_008375 [Tenebrio molitor]
MLSVTWEKDLERSSIPCRKRLLGRRAPGTKRGGLSGVIRRRDAFGSQSTASAPIRTSPPAASQKALTTGSSVFLTPRQHKAISPKQEPAGPKLGRIHPNALNITHQELLSRTTEDPGPDLPHPAAAPKRRLTSHTLSNRGG